MHSKRRIAPGHADGRRRKPRHCRLQWGRFAGARSNVCSSASPMNSLSAVPHTGREKHPTCSGQGQAIVGPGRRVRAVKPDTTWIRACAGVTAVPTVRAPTIDWRPNTNRTCDLPLRRLQDVALGTSLWPRSTRAAHHSPPRRTKHQPASVEPRTESEVPGTKQG